MLSTIEAPNLPAEQSVPLPSFEPEPVPNLVAFYNPVSTNNSPKTWERTRKRLEVVAQKAGYGLLVLETKPDPVENRQQIYDNIHEGDVIAVAAGDGSVNAFAQAKQHEDAPVPVVEAPILAIPLGNKSDLANTFNRFGWLSNLTGLGWRRIASALRQKRTVSMYPLIANFEPHHPPDSPGGHIVEPFKKLALYVMGFGATGAGAETLNNADWRDKHKAIGPKFLRPLMPPPAVRLMRLAREIKMAKGVIQNSESIEVSEDQGLTKDNVFDITIVNGPRVAGSWHFMIKPYTKEMLVSKTYKRTTSIATNMATRLLRFGHGLWVNGKHVLEFTADAPMTIDGEQMTAPAGRVTITHSERSVDFITSKKRYWGQKD